MKIGFNLDGQLIEGKFRGARDWHFTTSNDYVKQYYPSGEVHWVHFTSDPNISDENSEYKIWAKLAEIGEDMFGEALVAIELQDYQRLKLACDKINLQNTLPNVKYIIAPAASGENNKLTDYKIEYAAKEGNIDFYNPKDNCGMAFFEVISVDSDGINNYSFNQIIPKIR